MPIPDQIKNILEDQSTIDEIKAVLTASFGWLIKKFQDGSFRPFLRKRVEKNEQATAAIIAYLHKRDGLGIDIPTLTAQVLGESHSVGENDLGEPEQDGGAA